MKDRINSFGYAIEGIKLVFKTEINMRLHGVAAVSVYLLGFIFKISVIEFSIITICIMAVFAVEIINTIFEKYLDFYHPDFSPKVKILKDMAAGAVLICAFFSVIIAFYIFLPKIFDIYF